MTSNFLKTVFRSEVLLKKSLWHRCFPANFAKFLRTPFLTEHLRWLLLHFNSFHSKPCKRRYHFKIKYDVDLRKRSSILPQVKLEKSYTRIWYTSILHVESIKTSLDVHATSLSLLALRFAQRSRLWKLRCM